VVAFRVVLCAAAAVLASACSPGGSRAVPPAAPVNAAPMQAERTVDYVSAFVGHVPQTDTYPHFLPPQNSPQLLAAQAVAAALVTPAPLTYHNGPVQTHPVVYTLFWGSAWNTTAGDPAAMKPFLKTFYKTVGASKWLNDVRQYAQADGSIVDNEAALQSGSWNDTANALTSAPTYAALAGEALAAVAHWGDYSVNANYVIVTPKGVVPQDFGTRYCAFHDAAFVAAKNAWISYTVLPYLADTSYRCGAGRVATINDGVSIVAGHELAESLTDPLPVGNVASGYYGWIDASQSEIGDKCAWLHIEINPTIGDGLTYATQPLWNNDKMTCRQEPLAQW
jgi:hypothetical protein